MADNVVTCIGNMGEKSPTLYYSYRSRK